MQKKIDSNKIGGIFNRINQSQWIQSDFSPLWHVNHCVDWATMDVIQMFVCMLRVHVEPFHWMAVNNISRISFNKLILFDKHRPTDFFHH